MSPVTLGDRGNRLRPKVRTRRLGRSDDSSRDESRVDREFLTVYEDLLLTDIRIPNGGARRHEGSGLSLSSSGTEQWRGYGSSVTNNL